MASAELKQFIVDNDIVNMSYKRAKRKGFLQHRTIETKYGKFKFYFANEMDYESISGNMTKSVFSGEYYNRIPPEIQDKVIGLRWADLGANHGWFAVKCDAVLDPEFIVAVEPLRSTWTFLRKNMRINCTGDHLALQAAVVADNATEVEFSVGAKSGSLNSILDVRGRPKQVLPAININKLISQHEINAIKMDIEGYEYRLVPKTDWSPIKLLILEYHYRYLDNANRGPKYKKTIKRLKRNFDNVVYDPSMKQRFGTHIVCWDDDINGGNM